MPSLATDASVTAGAAASGTTVISLPWGAHKIAAPLRRRHRHSAAGSNTQSVDAGERGDDHSLGLGDPKDIGHWRRIGRMVHGPPGLPHYGNSRANDGRLSSANCWKLLANLDVRRTRRRSGKISSTTQEILFRQHRSKAGVPIASPDCLAHDRCTSVSCPWAVAQRIPNSHSRLRRRPCRHARRGTVRVRGGDHTNPVHRTKRHHVRQSGRRSAQEVESAVGIGPPQT